MTEESPKPETPLTLETLWKRLESKAVSLGVPGILAGLGVKQIMDNPANWQRALPWWGAAAMAWLVLAIAKRLTPKIEQLLDWSIGAVGRLAQYGWAELSDRFEAQYYQRLVSDCRDFEGRGFNAGALRLEDVYVPLNLVEKSAESAIQNLIRQVTATSGQQQIGALIRTLDHKTSSCRRLIILGAPGSGKSTLLRHVTLMYALRRQRQLGPKVPRLIPVLVRLRDVYPRILEKPDLNLVDVVEEVVKGLRKSDPLKTRSGWFGKRLRRGNCLVMLDGLDEIPEDEQRQQISQWVDGQLEDYSEARFILTSRPDAYRRAPLQENVIESEVQPLSPKERNALIYNWCRNWRRSQTQRKLDAGDRDRVEQQAQDLIGQIEATPSLRLMATNPLLLVLMAKTHSEKGVLSQRRVDIYKDVCQVLLEGRSRLKSLANLPTNPVTPLSADRKQAILQTLALAMTQAETLQFTLDPRMTRARVFDQVATILQQQLERVPNCPLTPQAFITRDEVGVRELISDRQQEGIYEFAHRSFQEYLTAVELKRTGQIETLCAAFVAGDKALDWWREVILFYAAQADATPLLEAAMRSPMVASLSMAYECLQVTEDVDETVKRDLDILIERYLQSPEQEPFIFAAEVLLMARLKRLTPDYREGGAMEGSIMEEFHDSEAVTSAEYYLSLPHLPSQPAFTPRDQARQPISRLDFQEASRFCGWLHGQSQQMLNQTGICYYPQLSETGTLRLIRWRIPVSYQPLADLLATGQWREADRETYRLMITRVGKQEGDLLNHKDLETFPCEDLLTLDQLWVKYSQGRFGFSVQKQIWQACGSPTSRGKKWDDFCVKVGWKNSSTHYLDYKDLKAHPTISPAGEFPWEWWQGWVEFSSLAPRIVNSSR